MKRLLILGASILQLPAIKKAKEMGLYVGVADYNPNAVGISYADEFFEVSTIDENGVYEVAKKFKADGIMTMATDMPMRSIAYASEKLNLNSISYETALNATDKARMIKVFKEKNVSHPWFFILENIKDVDLIEDKITYPCISKPTDNAGSRGVMLINNKKDLIKSLQYSSSNGRSGSVIIEEYLEGSEVSVEIVVFNGKVNILQITDKITTGAPHFIELGHMQPSNLEDKDKKSISELAIKAADAIGIKNGVAHVEIMLTKDGPKMIELGARLGGDCITSHLVPLSTGIDMVKATIDISLGNKPDIEFKFDKGSAINFIFTKPGIVKAISNNDAFKMKGVVDVSINAEIGDLVKKLENSTDRLGFIIAQGNTNLEAMKICEDAKELINIDIL